VSTTRRLDRGPDVTVVISCYQQAGLLGSAIDSVLAQTTPVRIIVVDDGSDDGSALVAESRGVRVERLAHRGALETFRAGVDLVETPFYCLLNADDELDPSYVELTHAEAADPTVGFVYTGMQLVGAEVGTTSVTPFDLQSLRWGNYVHAASLTRKAAYDSVGGFDRLFASHHEDWALWVAIARAGWKAVAVDRPLLRYRRHAQGSRNPQERRTIEQARWRLFRRHPGLYGLGGVVRLAGSSIRLGLTGR
jgi:glycosyltransferase involved in cell wall biosynthesis